MLFVVPLLAAHLLCMNFATAAPLVCLWLEWRERRDPVVGWLTDRAARSAWLALCVGAILGLGVGYWFWDPHYAAVLRRLRPKLEMGAIEWLFSLVLLIAYAVWRQRRRRAGNTERALRCLLPLLAGTNLLYHFPLLFAVLSEAASGRLPGDKIVTPAVFRSFLSRGDIWSEATHFWLASFAATGVGGLAWIWWRPPSQRDAERPAAQRLATWCARLALVPTMLQIPVGIWVLASQSTAVQRRLLGEDLAASSALAIGVGLSLLLLQLLADVSFGDTRPLKLRRLLLVYLTLTILMTAVLQKTKTRRPESLSAALRSAKLHATCHRNNA